jgi:hypothetical protein
VRIPVGFTVFIRLVDTLVSVVNVTIRKPIIAVGERTSHVFVRLRLDVGPNDHRLSWKASRFVLMISNLGHRRT